MLIVGSQKSSYLKVHYIISGFSLMFTPTIIFYSLFGHGQPLIIIIITLFYTENPDLRYNLRGKSKYATTRTGG